MAALIVEINDAFNGINTGPLMIYIQQHSPLPVKGYTLAIVCMIGFMKCSVS